jgi:hypothetical protein
VGGHLERILEMLMRASQRLVEMLDLLRKKTMASEKKSERPLKHHAILGCYPAATSPEQL